MRSKTGKPIKTSSPEDPGECTLCPRECRVDRSRGEVGFCRTGPDFNIASVCVHRGEEPPISGESGICNIFFSGCNLRCRYCQNYQISRDDTGRAGHRRELTEIVEEVKEALAAGVRHVGFVSPSHCVPQMKLIVAALREEGLSFFTVMNSNAYDKVGTLKSLEGLIDVYLPDLKYLDGELAERYSGARDYPEAAGKALREMFRQKGAEVELTGSGLIGSGLIVRHLVLPGQVANSKACLRFIAEELSPSVHISLMAQYHPTPEVAGDPELGRALREDEYEEVLEEMEKLGFTRGWTQELDSQEHYLPDFTRPRPFER